VQERHREAIDRELQGFEEWWSANCHNSKGNMSLNGYSRARAAWYAALSRERVRVIADMLWDDAPLCHMGWTSREDVDKFAKRLAALSRVDVKPLSESWDNLTLFLERLWGPKKDWEDVQRFAVNCVALEVNELKAALSDSTPTEPKE